MNLLEEVKSQLAIFSKNWKEKRYLLATSGGGDSMALLHLFKQLELKITVAHVNFNLRGEESNGDQQLVENTCTALSIPFHVHSANTNQYAKKHSLSIQEAARDIRYSWFEQLTIQHSLGFIVTAHHRNDSIETFFINLLRGAGVKGLSGIPAKNGKIIRPLLNAKKEAITRYLKQHKILFREDSSNASEKYLRNNIRHIILPSLLQMDSNAENAILQSIQHLNDTHSYLEKKINEDIQRISTIKEGLTYINTDNPIELIVLLQLLTPFGFTVPQISDLHKKPIQAGSTIQSSMHELLIDRNKWIIRMMGGNEKEKCFVFSEYGTYTQPFPIQFKKIETKTKYSSSKLIEHLDADTIQFPLTLRKWKEGDAFIPLGMQHKKKLSDFFIDQKISRFEKENMWILTDSEKIIWIVGHRISDAVKTTPATKKILKIETQLETLP